MSSASFVLRKKMEAITNDKFSTQVTQSITWAFSLLGFLLCWRGLQNAPLFLSGISGGQIPPLVASWNPREQINTSTLSYPPCNLSPSSLTFVFSLALGLVVWQRGERMRLAYVDVYVPLQTTESQLWLGRTRTETRSWKTRGGWCYIRTCQEFMTRTWATRAAMIYYPNHCFRQPWQNSKSWAFIIEQKYNTYTYNALKWKSWNVSVFIYCIFNSFRIKLRMKNLRHWGLTRSLL